MFGSPPVHIRILEQNAHNKDSPAGGHDEKSDGLNWKEAILEVEDLPQSSRQNNLDLHHPTF